MTFVPSVFCESFLHSYCVSFDMLLATVIDAAFTLTQYEYLVQYGLFIRVKLVREEHSRSLVQAQALVIQLLLKIW